MSTTTEICMYAAAGALAGLRASAAPAAVGDRLHRRYVFRRKQPAHWMDAPNVRIGLRMLTSLEMAADKLPGAMRRTRWPALIARIGSGAACGAALSVADRRGWQLGAAVGAAAAAVMTQLSHRARMRIAHSLRVPQTWVGFAEDTLVLAGSQAIMHAPR